MQKLHSYIRTKLDSYGLIITFLMFCAIYGGFFTSLLILFKDNGSSLYLTGRMWSPAFAAFTTFYIYKRSFNDLGWLWNHKYITWSYFIPLIMVMITYILIWTAGFGTFYNPEFLIFISNGLGLSGLNPILLLLIYFILSSTLGMVKSLAYALGEEIGWRGLLVPELFGKIGYLYTSILTGLIWSIWHFPMIFYTDYSNGGPTWFALICFTVMITSSCFAYVWLRIKSGSLWTGVFFHASHNLFIQKIFTPLTLRNEYSKYFIDEFGIGMALVSILLGLYFWSRRSEIYLDVKGEAT